MASNHDGPAEGAPFRALAVFCGSRTGNRPQYAESARQLGALLAGRGIEVVYGGGSIGMMGILARAALQAGGKVTGVIPDSLVQREVEQKGLTRMHVVDSMHERKALMADLADGFIALPGGYGTLEEYFEVLTWAQLRFHAKPVGLLDVAGFFQPVIALFDHMVAEGFVGSQHRALALADADPVALLDRMAQYRAAAPGPAMRGDLREKT
jgi:uncharacterized protein (TIGR00730 family)